MHTTPDFLFDLPLAQRHPRLGKAFLSAAVLASGIYATIFLIVTH